MAIRRKRGNAASLARQTAEVAMAAPQVIAHRMTRMALAGPELSERDRKEFSLMGMEKAAAFTQSWQAMMLSSMMSAQKMAMQMWVSCWMPWLGGARGGNVSRQMQNATMTMLGKGIAPIHAKATANARRLAGTPLLPTRGRRKTKS